jgi:nitrogen fixation protein FixH
MNDSLAPRSKRISQDNPSGWRNPWMLSLIGLIVIVLMVNIGFITLAFVTSPGLVSKDYYEQAEEYEANVLKRIAARNQLGWTYNTDFPQNPLINRAETYRVNLVDKQGIPLDKALVMLKAYRPSDADADFNVEMAETIPGVYEAKVTYPLKGFWDITIDIKRGEDIYDFTRRASVVTE